MRLINIAVFSSHHVKDGLIKIRPGKTTGTSGVTVEIPVPGVLQKAIEESPTGNLAFLVSGDRGRPFTTDRLRTNMYQWRDKTGLPQCSLHGLRKAGATIAVENSATDDELMAIFGWTTEQQATLYTKHASRKRLAGAAIHKLLPDQNQSPIVPQENDPEKVGQKQACTFTPHLSQPVKNWELAGKARKL